MGEVKERPILFSGPMVRALLEGRKTQTRREVSERQRIGYPHGEINAATPTAFTSTGAMHFAWQCPYGQPGDRLWVRETWRSAASLDSLSPTAMAHKALEAGWTKPWAPIKYEADGHEVNTNTMFGAEWGKTRVSIHMPRWASRLMLEVTEVRVQRLCEISEEDAKAEGISCLTIQSGPTTLAGRPWATEFRLLWDSINGAGTWNANPWAWAVSFRVVTP